MYARILVPVDGSGASTLGLREAVRLAQSFGSRLRLFHVVNEFLFDYTYSPSLYTNEVLDLLRKQGKEVLDQASQAVKAQGLEHDCILLESVGGVAANLILEQAASWPAELIVMGTHGRRGLRRLALGSDAEQVVRAARIPVLLVNAHAAVAADRASRNAA